MKDQLIRKFADRTAVIGIVGLGYVGLPLMLRYTDAGFRVLGFDIDTFKTTFPPEKLQRHVKKVLKPLTTFLGLPKQMPSSSVSLRP